MKNELTNKNSFLPALKDTNSIRTETWAGKATARVTKIMKQNDGSEIKQTRRINKDGSITDKVEHRHR